MGFDLAFAKAQDSSADQIITWTSAVFELLEDEPGIKVTVKAEILAEVGNDIDEMFKHNTVTVDKLRELAGRATCIASLIHVWRPFVAMLWGPIYSSPLKVPVQSKSCLARCYRYPPGMDEGLPRRVARQP